MRVKKPILSKTERSRLSSHFNAMYYNVAARLSVMEPGLTRALVLKMYDTDIMPLDLDLFATSRTKAVTKLTNHFKQFDKEEVLAQKRKFRKQLRKAYAHYNKTGYQYGKEPVDYKAFSAYAPIWAKCAFVIHYLISKHI